MRDYTFEFSAAEKKKNDVSDAIHRAERRGVPQTQFGIVFVRNIPRVFDNEPTDKYVLEEELEETFRHFGDVVAVNVFKAPGRHIKGTAQVAFSELEHADRAINAGSIEYEGHTLNISEWLYYIRSGRRGVRRPRIYGLGQLNGPVVAHF